MVVVTSLAFRAEVMRRHSHPYGSGGWILAQPAPWEGQQRALVECGLLNAFYMLLELGAHLRPGLRPVCGDGQLFIFN